MAAVALYLAFAFDFYFLTFDFWFFVFVIWYLHIQLKRIGNESFGAL